MNPPNLIAHLLDEHYLLKRLLNHGGFGFVFEAREVVRGKEVGRPLAVKIVPERKGASLPQMPELEFAAALEHPNLVTCLSVGHCTVPVGKGRQPVFYVVMELADESLQDVVKRKPLAPAELRDVLRDIAAGLSFIHSLNAVHRDLKPGNVLRRGGAWKISDFGLVRNVQAPDPGGVAGTYYYIAPEAWDGQVGTALDIWSLGVLAVVAATGTLPFFEPDTRSLIEAVKQKVPVMNRQQLGELLPLVEECLAKNPRRRPTASDIVRRLSPPPRLGDREVVVTPGEPGAIGRAVAKAGPGTRILLRPGTYRESFRVGNDIEIVGEGGKGAVVIEVPAGEAIELRSDGRLARLSISADDPAADGIVRIVGGSPVVEDCTLNTRSRTGLVVSGRTAPVLRRVIVVGASDAGYVFRDRAQGYAELCVALNCGRTGVFVADEANPTLKGCAVFRAGWRAVFVAQGGQGVFINCILSQSSKTGVELAAWSRASFIGCRMLETAGATVHAVSRSESTFIDCTFDGGGKGERLSSGHRVSRIRSAL